MAIGTELINRKRFFVSVKERKNDRARNVESLDPRLTFRFYNAMADAASVHNAPSRETKARPAVHHAEIFHANIHRISVRLICLNGRQFDDAYLIRRLRDRLRERDKGGKINFIFFRSRIVRKRHGALVEYAPFRNFYLKQCEVGQFIVIDKGLPEAAYSFR